MENMDLHREGRERSERIRRLCKVKNIAEWMYLRKMSGTDKSRDDRILKPAWNKSPIGERPRNG